MWVLRPSINCHGIVGSFVILLCSNIHEHRIPMHGGFFSTNHRRRWYASLVNKHFTGSRVPKKKGFVGIYIYPWKHHVPYKTRILVRVLGTCWLPTTHHSSIMVPRTSALFFLSTRKREGAIQNKIIDTRYILKFCMSPDFYETSDNIPQGHLQCFAGNLGASFCSLNICPECNGALIII